MCRTWKDWAEVFTIFAKYGEGKAMTSAEDGLIYSGPDPNTVSDEDKKRLLVLSWHPNTGYECFYIFT